MSFLISPIILLAEFLGAASDIANRRNSKAVDPSVSLFADTGEDQIATA